MLDKQVVPNIALFSNNSGSNPDPEGFMYDKANNRYECPAGNYLNQCQSVHNNIAVYYSKAPDCKACTITESCTAKLKAKNKVYRLIIRNVHKDLFDQVKEWMTQESFQNNLVERMWKMEGLISEVKNLHGLSRAKYRSLKKTQIQAYMAAIALNLKRLAKAFYLLFLTLKYINICYKRIFVSSNSQ